MKGIINEIIVLDSLSISNTLEFVENLITPQI